MLPTISKEQLERLAFCRYLLQQAKFHLTKGSPLSSFSILIIHDLTEMFLQVALEVHCPGAKKDYSKILESMTGNLNTHLSANSQPPISVALIQKINSVRNGLKHSTIFANESVVSDLYNDVSALFEKYLKIFFDAEIEEISIVQLIQNDFVRSMMSDAEMNLKNSKLLESMVAIGKGFHVLLDTEMVVRNSKGMNIIGKRPHRNHFQSRQRKGSIKDQDTKDEFRSLDKLLDEYFDALNDRIGTIEVSSLLGIDFKSYTAFAHMLPTMYLQSPTTEDQYPFYVASAPANYTAENVDFCFEFMIDVCFRLQSIKTSSLPRTPPRKIGGSQNQ